MRLANKNDILFLSNMRVSQQKEDWDNQYEDLFGLFNETKRYLEKHLNEVIKFSKEMEISELNLSSDNEKAISIYKKIGFQPDGLIMSLKI